MEINKLIKVTYELNAIDEEGREQIEIATKDRPCFYVSGLGIMLDAFEAQINPLSTGEKFDFTLKPEDAFGEYDEDKVIDIPREAFERDGKLDTRYIYEDAVVPLQNADGMRFNGTIVKIGDKQITVDLNHPLAGKSLNYVGEVLESREATKDEIQGMLKMLTGEGCSCGGGCGEGGCGGCGGGCGEGGCGGCGGGCK